MALGPRLLLPLEVDSGPEMTEVAAEDCTGAVNTTKAEARVGKGCGWGPAAAVGQWPGPGVWIGSIPGLGLGLGVCVERCLGLCPVLL